jgi:hypothetical protein
MPDQQSLALCAFVRIHDGDRYLVLPCLLTSAAKHLAEINRRNQLWGVEFSCSSSDGSAMHRTLANFSPIRTRSDARTLSGARFIQDDHEMQHYRHQQKQAQPDGQHRACVRYSANVAIRIVLSAGARAY